MYNQSIRDTKRAKKTTLSRSLRRGERPKKIKHTNLVPFRNEWVRDDECINKEDDVGPFHPGFNHLHRAW